MPISAAERFQIAPTGRQQEAAQLGTPLVLVVFFWRGKCAKIINSPWNTTPGAQIEDPQAGLRYFFLEIKIWPTEFTRPNYRPPPLVSRKASIFCHARPPAKNAHV